MLIKSGSEQMRQQNILLVLSGLRRHGPQSHTDLGTRTGLSSATVSAITVELEKAGVLERSEQQPGAGRGRPRVLFSQARNCGYLITAQISSDAVQYSLVDYAGRLIDRFDEARRHDAQSTSRFAPQFREALARLADRSRLAREAVMAISISSKGTVDADGHRLLWSPLLGEQEIDFAALLAPDWRAVVTLSNETLLVAQALGIAAKPSTEDHALAVVSLGHSIGLGIVRVRRHDEVEASAPNFGHMLHAPGGGLCRCGGQGCIEATAGFYGILRTAFQVPADTIPAKFVPLPEMDKIAQTARGGNRMAGYAFRQAGLALGNGLSRLMSFHGRLPIVFTGPGTRYFDLLAPGIDEGLSASHEVRLKGRPEITVHPDEQRLVFEGHLDRALTGMDQAIAEARLSPSEKRSA
ncbi:putative NBD/HSP70 family sugar kinase [Rhizobium sp. PP-WC-2G-219]|nr:putative NBD/HSP70 family sugar kinase [Rhizobium sp. PP-WC-2G-219]